MQPNFEEMTNAELRAYALAHRDDIEPLRVLYSRRSPDSEATWYGPMCTSEGVPIEENIRIAEEAIRQRADRDSEALLRSADREKQREKELQKERELEERLRQKIEQEVEAKLRQKIEQERVSFGKGNMTTVTQEEIQQFREQLRDYPEALTALDVIEEYDGNLPAAAKAIAIRNDIEGVADYGLSDWFDERLQECRNFICQPKNRSMTKNYLPALIPPLADLLAGSLGCPPGVAAIIATPFAVYINDEGLDKFCESFDSQP
jgi:hypothetical protein